jgi:hypothetical protein
VVAGLAAEFVAAELFAVAELFAASRTAAANILGSSGFEDGELVLRSSNDDDVIPLTLPIDAAIVAATGFG